MMRRLLGAWVVGMLIWGCGSTAPAGPASGDEGLPEALPPEGGDDEDELPPGGDDDVEAPPGDGEEDPPPEEEDELTAGPWPMESVLNYSLRYELDEVQSVGVDEGYNIWLLDGDRIGVLRPGDTAPTWTEGVGQAEGGFGSDELATGSTVICGGSAGRAYVGYSADELDDPFIYGPDGRSFPAYDDPDPGRYKSSRYQEYQKGDMDVVRLLPDGRVVLEEHLQRSARVNGPRNLGIRNTNDHHFDEDRTVLSCMRVMRGRHKGQLYIGTNHGVTRLDGLTYNSHRHPVWFKEGSGGDPKQMAGYTYALGLGLDGEVLIGNEWNLGIVMPSEDLADWDRVDESLNRSTVTSAHLPEVNRLEEKDYWRGFQQTTDGRYYLASARYGLWELHIRDQNEVSGTKLPGAPDALTALAATGDGSLFIGTRRDGLWRLDTSHLLTRVDEVEGDEVKQLVYDPTVLPSMLYILTDEGLTVLRGP